MIVFWMLFGVRDLSFSPRALSDTSVQTIAGYVSSRLYASLRGEEWRKNVALTSVLFPTLLFTALHLLNFFLIGAGSSGAVPFGTFMAIVALWFLINIPLTVAGAVVGGKKGVSRLYPQTSLSLTCCYHVQAVSHPVRVNQIPRQIPPTEWWLKPWPSAIIAGVLPFGTPPSLHLTECDTDSVVAGAGCIETYFVLQSLFGAKAYYAFGFLALTSAVVALTTATTTILMCYFALSAEEYRSVSILSVSSVHTDECGRHRWHWRSFLAGGGSAFWLMAYGMSPPPRLNRIGTDEIGGSGLLYWATKLHLAGFANKVLYLSYLSLISLVVFLGLGSIGFLSTYAFLRLI